MARPRMARFGLSIAAAAMVLGLTASVAMAGEVTGSGKNPDHNQGKSWCSFSGHNDDPGAPLDGSGPNGPGGHSQSFGQDVKLGLADPHAGNPGVVCNPNRTLPASPAEPNPLTARSAPTATSGPISFRSVAGQPPMPYEPTRVTSTATGGSSQRLSISAVNAANAATSPRMRPG